MEYKINSPDMPDLKVQLGFCVDCGLLGTKVKSGFLPTGWVQFRIFVDLFWVHQSRNNDRNRLNFKRCKSVC